MATRSPPDALRPALLQSRGGGLLLDQGGRRRGDGPAGRGPRAAAKQGKLGPSLRLLPTTAATTLRKTDPPMVIDGPFAETKEQLLGFYVIDVADLEEALGVAARPRQGQSRRRLRDPAAAAFTCPATLPAAEAAGGMNDLDLDRCGPDLGASPGDRRPAALFPRPRHRRGGLSGRLPAGPEDLAAERPAARSRRLADHGRPQRRAGRRAQAEPRRPSCRRRRRSPTSTTSRAPHGRAAGRLALPRRHPAAAVHLLPSGPAGRASRSRWRCASSPGSSVRQIARAFLVGEAAMEQRITRAKARDRQGRACPSRRRARRSGPSALAAVAAHGLPGLQRGLFAPRRRGRGARAAVRRGDPAGAPAAAALPDRAGDHGADRPDAAAARPRRRPLRRRRARSCCWTTRTASLWNREHDRRGPGADRQGACATAGPAPTRCRPPSPPCTPAPARAEDTDWAQIEALYATLELHAALAGGDAEPRRGGQQGARAGRGAGDDRAAGRAAGRLFLLLRREGRASCCSSAAAREAREAFDQAIALANTAAEAAHIRQQLDRLMKDSAAGDVNIFPGRCRRGRVTFVLGPEPGELRDARRETAMTTETATDTKPPANARAEGDRRPLPEPEGRQRRLGVLPEGVRRPGGAAHARPGRQAAAALPPLPERRLADDQRLLAGAAVSRMSRPPATPSP